MAAALAASTIATPVTTMRVAAPAVATPAVRGVFRGGAQLCRPARGASTVARFGSGAVKGRLAVWRRSSSSSSSSGVRASSSAAPSAVTADAENTYDLHPSGLHGKAMTFPHKDQFPTRAEVLASIPQDCFRKDTLKSLMYAAVSTAMTLACGALAYMFIPLQLAFLPVWIAYAVVTGTVATGCWVVAHECGHNAFSDNRTLQDAVGYMLHSLMLVPYFSWQRSHAVHHSRTNHLTEGETHVPYIKGELKGTLNLALKDSIGEGPFAIVQLLAHLVFGWPAYLLTGETGGSSRGVTNHFIPSVNTGPVELFPGTWKNKVWMSDVGVAAVAASLVYWASKAGFDTVAALYFGPYMVVNAWLVLYTWLQHTDTDVPHLAASEWSYIKGAFLTIDRPYGAVFDFLHHRIGSTHVAHHVECSIPHYKAVKATNALKEKYPHLYLYDPTPIAQALWRVAAKCVAVEKRGEGKDTVWTFIDKKEAPQTA